MKMRFISSTINRAHKELCAQIKLIHLVLESGNKVFGFGWRLALTALIIFFFASGLSPLRFFQASIVALTGPETKTANFYAALSDGEWQNPQNVQGQPDVGPTGDINLFSETNSAIYKTGSLNLVIQNFMVEGQRPNDQQQEIISTPTEETITVATFTEEIIGATSTPEVIEETTSTKVETSQEQQEETTSTPPIQEIYEEEINTETTSTESESEPISFFGKVKKIFSGETVKAQQLPTFEELVEEDFQSAKIKLSFAIGEKEPDITIIEQQATSVERD